MIIWNLDFKNAGANVALEECSFVAIYTPTVKSRQVSSPTLKQNFRACLCLCKVLFPQYQSCIAEGLPEHDIIGAQIWKCTKELYVLPIREMCFQNKDNILFFFLPSSAVV